MRIFNVELILFLVSLIAYIILFIQISNVYSSTIINGTIVESDIPLTIEKAKVQQNNITNRNDIFFKDMDAYIIDPNIRYPYDNNNFLPPYTYKGLPFSHYSNYTFGMDFDYPTESWYSKLIENNNELFINLPPLSFNEIVNGSIENTIQIKKYSLPYDFLIKNNTIIDFAKSVIGDKMSINFDIITIDKVLAIKYETETENYNIIYTFIIHEDEAYVIKTIINKKLLHYIYPEIDKMINSIKLSPNSSENVNLYCKKNSVNSTNFVTEIQIPFVCPIPSGILLDHNQNIWFVSSKHGLLFQFDPDTKQFSKYLIPSWNEREVIDGKPSIVWEIKQDKNNNIWFTDEIQNSIWKFSLVSKSFERYIIPSNKFLLSYPVSFDFDSKGNIYFIELDIPSIWFGNITEMRNGLSAGIYEIPIPEKLVKRPSTFYYGSLLLQNDTKIWTSLKYGDGNGKLIAYDINKMSFHAINLSPKISSPIRMTMDNSEKIWITNFESNSFFEFNPQTMKLKEYITSPLDSRINNNTNNNYNYFTAPFEITTGPNNTIWFTEYLGNKIAQFIPEERILIEYWIPGTNSTFCINERNTSFCGNYADVSQFSVNDDMVWFTERMQNNIGFVDVKKEIPFSIEIDKEEIIAKKGQNKNVTISIKPNYHLEENNTLTLIESSTIPKNHISIVDLGSFNEKSIILDDKKSVVYKLSISENLKNGRYTLMLGAGNNEIAIMKAMDLVIVG